MGRRSRQRWRLRLPNWLRHERREHRRNMKKGGTATALACFGWANKRLGNTLQRSTRIIREFARETERAAAVPQ